VHRHCCACARAPPRVAERARPVPRRRRDGPRGACLAGSPAASRPGGAGVQQAGRIPRHTPRRRPCRRTADAPGARRQPRQPPQPWQHRLLPRRPQRSGRPRGWLARTPDRAATSRPKPPPPLAWAPTGGAAMPSLDGPTRAPAAAPGVASATPGAPAPAEWGPKRLSRWRLGAAARVGCRATTTTPSWCCTVSFR